MEIASFVDTLLAKPPGPPRSVELEVDTDGDVCALFECLLLIMTEMLKRWYPPPITIGRVSDTDLARMIDYYASFNIRFSLQVRSEPQPPIRNREYVQQSRLEDMMFQVSDGGKRYIVRFSSTYTT